jgi:hypothetical protein
MLLFIGTCVWAQVDPVIAEYHDLKEMVSSDELNYDEVVRLWVYTYGYALSVYTILEQSNKQPNVREYFLKEHSFLRFLLEGEVSFPLEEKYMPYYMAGLTRPFGVGPRRSIYDFKKEW